MSIGTPFLDGSMNAADKSTAVLGNMFAKHMESAKDDMFAQKHGLSSDQYQANDYYRFGFTSKNEMNLFAESMQSEGISVATTQHKYNGQYLVEVQKVLENGTQTSDYIANYEKTTSKSLHGAREESYDTGIYSNNVTQSIANEVLLKNIDGWQETFGGISSVMKWANADAYQSDTRGTDIFKHQENVMGEISMSARVGQNAQKAIVLNGDTVVINGHIVTDENIRADILRQHQERMEYAHDITSNINTAAGTLSAKQDLAQRITDNVYNQEYAYDAHTPDMDKVSMLCQWTHGVLNDITNEFNTANVAYSIAAKEALTGQGFSEEQINRFQKRMEESGLSQSLVFGADDKAREIMTQRMSEECEKAVNLIDRKITDIDNQLKALEGKIGQADIGRYADLSRQRRELEEKRIIVQQDNATAVDMAKKLSNLEMSEAQKKMLKGLDEGNTMRFLATSDLFKGLNINFAQMGAEDLLKINKAFLEKSVQEGISFITPLGKFDIAKMHGLSQEQWRRIGITDPQLQKKLIEINSRGSFGRSSSRATTLVNMAASVSGFLYKHMLDDKEFLEDVENVKKAASYTQKAVKVVQKGKNIRLEELRNIRRERPGTNSNTSKKFNNKKGKNNKNPKPFDGEKELKKAQKYAEKQKNQLAKIEKKQRGLRAKATAKYRKVQEALAKSWVGKLWTVLSKALVVVLKVVLIVLALLALILILFFIVLVLILFLISSFANVNPQEDISNALAPTVYQETVAWQLFEFLSTQEDEWVDSIQNVDNMHRDRKEMKYGSGYTDYNSYIAGDVRFIEKDGKLYINPFSKDGVVSETENAHALTQTTTYDGTPRYDILTNANIYNKIDASATKSIENGHTSNIKDILCMVDVMYSFDMDTNSDEGLDSVLGKAPAQLEWDSFCEKIKNVFRWIGNKWNEWFGDSEDPPYILVQTFNYRTIQNYAATLFQCSHQQVLNLDIIFYDLDRKVQTTNSAGEVIDLNNSKVAQEFGVCGSPMENSFKIGWNTWQGNGRISPYLEHGGAKYYLDRDEFDGKVLIENVSEGETLCLQMWYASDQATFNALKTMVDDADDPVFDDPCCWSYVKTEESITSTGTGTSKSSAEDDADDDFDGYNPNNEYTLSDDRNTFVAVLYEANASLDYSSSKTYDGGPICNVSTHSSGCSCGGYEDDEWTSTCTWGKKITYTFTRECDGHKFKYCGGHIACKSQGIVFSTTNEQLAIAGLYEKDNVPAVDTFLEQDAPLMGYDTLRGKVNQKTISDSNIVSASTSGGCKNPLQDIQGSYPGMKGLNLWVQGEKWVYGQGGINADTGYPPKYMKDIFDVDCALEKGGDIFPLNTWQDYEGWTAENMNMVLYKMSIDWHEMYEFDIPYEISSSTTDTALSQEDIDAIIEALEAEYGSLFTDNRKEAVKLALKWVNRGHYVEGHSNHAFLSDYCVAEEATAIVMRDENGVETSMKPKGNCTGGTDIDFANYVYTYCGKITSPKTSYKTSTAVANGFGNVLPADVVTHSGIANGNVVDLPYAGLTEGMGWFDTQALKLGLLQMSAADARRVYDRYIDTRVILFIGVLNQEIELSTGQKLAAGVPIYIDMQKEVAGGAVRLHGSSSVGLTSADDNVYYWVDHLDGRATRYSFE